MIFHGAQYSSRQATELLTRSSTEVPDTETLDNDPSLGSKQELAKHVTEMNQEIKCTVTEISLIKDRISSLETEIKTLKLFPWFY